MAPVLLVTYLENSCPVTTLHCPTYLKIWLFLIPDSTWWTAGTSIRNTSVPQKCHPCPPFSLVNEKPPKADQRDSYSSQDLPTVLEFLKQEGIQVLAAHVSTRDWYSENQKNLNQNKKAIFNWRSPKTLTVHRLTVFYFYWVCGSVSCQVTLSPTREGCSHLHPSLRVSDQPLDN